MNQESQDSPRKLPIGATKGMDTGAQSLCKMGEYVRQDDQHESGNQCYVRSLHGLQC